MRLNWFGKIIYLPKWLKFVLVIVVFASLCIAGYTVKSKSKITLQSTETPSVSVQASLTPIPNTATPVHTPKATHTPQKISVYVVGCVKNPSVVSVPSGSLIKAAVDAAGGFTQDADREAINLADVLYDNMMIKVPSKKETSLLTPSGNSNWITTPRPTQAPENSGTHGQTETENSGKVNINTAQISDLCTLPGIGESTAQKIIDYRNKNGRFEHIEDIMNVPGIKESRFEAIKDMITV